MPTMLAPHLAPRWMPTTYRGHGGHGGGGGQGGAAGFGSVVGEFEHEVNMPGGQPHARLEINAGGRQVEADINVHSLLNPDGSKGGSDVLYAVKDQVVSQMPTDGEQMGGTFSYDAQGWKASDFKDVSDNTLHQLLINLAQNSNKVEVMGKFYSQSGIHDVHMNSGDINPSRDDNGHDGVVRFYTVKPDGIHMESVAIMFDTQHLAH